MEEPDMCQTQHRGNGQIGKCSIADHMPLTTINTLLLLSQPMARHLSTIGYQDWRGIFIRIL